MTRACLILAATLWLAVPIAREAEAGCCAVRRNLSDPTGVPHDLHEPVGRVRLLGREMRNGLHAAQK